MTTLTCPKEMVSVWSVEIARHFCDLGFDFAQRTRMMAALRKVLDRYANRPEAYKIFAESFARCVKERFSGIQFEKLLRMIEPGLWPPSQADLSRLTRCDAYACLKSDPAPRRDARPFTTRKPPSYRLVLLFTPTGGSPGYHRR